MTNANYPERWLNDRRISRLSDLEHRAMVLALTWSVANRTDGELLAGDLECMPKQVTPDTMGALVLAGLASVGTVSGEAGWTLGVYLETQTSAAALQAAELARRVKNAKQNAVRAARFSVESVSQTVSSLDQTSTDQTRPSTAGITRAPSTAGAPLNQPPGELSSQLGWTTTRPGEGHRSRQVA
jgi:hypothetical protein